MIKHSFLQFILLLGLSGALSLVNGQSFLTASLNTPGGAGILSESCDGPYELVLRRGVDNDSITTIFISATGTATIGVDYTIDMPFPVTLEESDSIVIIPISVISDALNEGEETAILELAFTYGIFSDQINFEFSITDEYEVEIESPTDTVVWCSNVPFVLLANSNAEEIFWSPASVFDDSLGTSATVRPAESGWYFASVGTDECGAKDSVYFNLAIVEINNPDTVFICKGEDVTLLGNLDGLATDFTWTPTDSLSNPEILNPVANPTITTTYVLQSDIGVCIASDRVVVKVDSLPADLHIDIAPAKPYYCAGETVALFSPTYDTLLYPDLTFLWTPNDGTIITNDSLLNVAILLQDTTLYKRENINNACTSKDSILINVIPPSVPLSVTDTMLCAGEMFTVEVLATMVTNPMWTPTEGLSCSQCFDPKVTVLGTPGSTLFYAFTGMILDCPVGASLTVRVSDTRQFSGPPVIVCLGDTVTVSTGDPTVFDLEWSVLSGNLSLGCTDCENPVVTVNSPSGLLRFFGETTDPNFCNVSGTVVVNTFSNDVGDIAIQPNPPIGQGSDVTAILDVVPVPSSVSWTLNGMAIPSTAISIVFAADEEVNFLEAKFINSKGCEQTDTVSIVTVPPSYNIPNAFTPNGDEKNDRFRVLVNGNIVVEEFLIFNRWGQLVYDAPTDDLTGWDGRLGDGPAASDTYVYSAKIRYPDGKTEIAKGDVMLIR